ncbi:hypothetical protein [Ralstonia solanacearum]|uniref:hypothetical protein n=1 Tax=Ralstonia solanacearum TaxID=305 RepID=UPI0022A9F933
MATVPRSRSASGSEISQVATDGGELDGPAALADGELALGRGDARDADVLLELGRLGLVLHQHQRLAHARQRVGRLEQQRDGALARQLPLHHHGVQIPQQPRNLSPHAYPLPSKRPSSECGRKSRLFSAARWEDCKI